MSKKMTVLSKRRKLVVLSIFGVVMGISIFAYFDQVSNQKPKLSFQTNEFSKDIVNDGVYTNYEYGFKFKYPEDIFVEQFNSVNHDGWYNEKGASTPFDLDENGVWAVVVFTESTKRFEDSVSRKFNLVTGETNSLGETKISSIEKTGYKNVVFFEKIPEEKGSEHSVSYKSEWIVDGRYISLSLSARENKDSLLMKYKNNFDQMVSSFEFFNPSTFY